jgi:hypothetical protein
MIGEDGNTQRCVCKHSLRYIIYFNSQTYGVRIPISSYAPVLQTHSIDATPFLRCRVLCGSGPHYLYRLRPGAKACLNYGKPVAHEPA